MGFRFKYEALLKYRMHLRERAEIALGAAQKELRQNREMMDEYKNSIIEVNERLGESLKNGVSSDHIRNYSSYVTILKVRMEQQAALIAKSEKKVAEKMKELLDRTMQCNVFEKLKERDLGKWQQDQNIIEQGKMNEAALLRYGKEFL